jgi:hypothetical protein
LLVSKASAGEPLQPLAIRIYKKLVDVAEKVKVVAEVPPDSVPPAVPV